MAHDLVKSRRFQESSVDEVRMNTSSFPFPPILRGASRALGGIAVLAALAASLLFLLPGGSVHAQDADLTHPENSTDAVATFTATDPEERMIYWSLADAGVDDVATADEVADHGDFTISADGVLRFVIPPDHEGADDEGTNNEYKIVVVASDDAPGAVTEGIPIKMGYEKVTVTVTDVDEPGMVTLSAEQPQASRLLTATLTDDDATAAQVTAAEWEWEHSSVAAGPWTPILTAMTSVYTPLGVEDKYLRVTATYIDKHDPDKTAQAVSANMVRAEPDASNAAPVFTDEDLDTADTINVNRSVDENSPPGTNVGKPVVANDAPGDVLTYTLTGTGADNENYRIDQATGQITVGPRTMLDLEGPNANASDTVTVTATDPAGGTVEQPVTITIKNVNEGPMMTEGFTRSSQPEYNDGTPENDVNDAVAAAKVVDTYVATDPEISDGICVMASCTWSVSGTDAGDFEISNVDGDGTFGALTFKEAPNYEKPADGNRDNVYMVTVVVSDGKLTAMRDVTITITNVDEDGTVTLSSEQPKVGIALTATLEDPDGVVADSVKWTWHNVDAENVGQATADVAIAMATSATYTPKMADIVLALGFLSAKASYTDGHGAGKSAVLAAANAVVENAANVAPKFPDTETGMREVAEGTVAGMQINDTAAADPAPVVATDANEPPDDPKLTYTLSGTDAASFSIDRPSGQLQTKAKLDYEAKDSYAVTVTATDSGGLSASIDVTITVTNVDEAPKIAGDDVTKDYPENGRAQVARFTATDPEGRMVYWSLATDPVGVEVTADDIADAGDFMISSGGVLSFKFSPDFEMPMGGSANDSNTYKVVVAASDNAPGARTEDNSFQVAYKKVTVTVTKVEETETVTLSALQAQVGVALTATYNDLDKERPAATEFTWKWYLGGTQIPDAGDTTTLGAADETPTSTYAPGVRGSLRVEASYTKTDGTKKVVSKTVSVREAPAAANGAPNFVEGGEDKRSVDENSPPGTRVGKPVVAIDPGDKLTYTLTGAGESSFDINQATGQITVGARTTLDTETTASFMVTVTATDPAGDAGGTAMQEVTITINNVNEAPMISAGFTRSSQPEYNDGTPENDVNDAVAAAKVVDTYVATDPEISNGTCVMDSCTWSVSGTDAGDFEISNETAAFGALTFKETPNYEKPADANRDNVYMVTVVATDSKKATAMRDVTITITNVDEAGTVTLSSEQPKVGIPLTATLEDPDGVVADSVKWTWHSNEDGMGGAIAMATSATYTPEAEGPLSAKASYADGHGAVKSAVLAAANAVVVNTENVAPKFPDTETGMREVAEGTVAGMQINDAGEGDDADPVVATDANDDTLTYTLGGADAASFSIDRGTAQLTTKAKLDYETKNSYMVTVTATDSDGLNASKDVTIKVTDMDEAPEITAGGLVISGTARVDYAEDRRDAVATYRASGPDADMANWTLEGVDAGDFDISSSGELTFVRAPDYETPADMGGDNMYQVTVKAADGTYMDTQDVTVRVMDVDEAIVGDALLAEFDGNDNMMIDKDEVIQAINDYLDSVEGVTKQDVIDVINRYLDS